MTEDIREFTIRDIISFRRPKVVVIGGGTGLSSILRGLKKYTDNITAIVTMGDDGGSSGRLRENLGLLPPGDIRNCILALADDEEVMYDLFNYRFSSGELEGHNFGNLFLAAMDGISDDFYQAVRRASDVLHIKGEVLPITLDPMVLEAQLEDGSLTAGESEIPKAALMRESIIHKLYLRSPENIQALDDSIQALGQANIITLGPGSLYTSLICNLLVPGIVEAIRNSSARKYYIANLMTQPGETDGFTYEEHLRTIARYTGGINLFDTAILNNGSIPEDVREDYKENGQVQIKREGDSSFIRMLEEDIIQIDSEGKIRHDADKLAEVLFEDYLHKREDSS